MGRFLAGGRHPDVVVATKLGRAGIYPDGYSRESLREATQRSLERLQVDALDLTQRHCVPTDVLRHGHVSDWPRELQQEGLVKRWGASVESVEEGSICLDQEGLASLQVIFNVFRQKPVEALFPRDRRHFNRDGAMFNVGEAFAELGLERGVDAAGQVARLVPEGMTMAQMALRRILDHREVSVVIPGASRPDQETANVSAADIAPLPAALHAQLAGFHRAHVRDFIRGPY